jgi:hypothetical protein
MENGLSMFVRHDELHRNQRALMREWLRVLIFVVLSCAGSSQGWGRDESAVLTFTHVPIGGAGATIGISSVPSANLLLARTDQYGCYLSVNNSQWTPLIKVSTFPAGIATVTTSGAPLGNGSGECIADPGNVNNIWLETNGGIFLSSNQGASFSKTCYPPQTPSLSPSQVQATKTFSHFIAVDPNNSNVVYMSTPGSGLIGTFDKGTTCFTISGVGTASALGGSGGGHLIAFDTAAGTTNLCPHGVSRCTKNIYVSTYGKGVYKSTDGGVSWTLTVSTPTTHVSMAADNVGNLWFLDNSNNNGLGALRKYNGTTWSSPSIVSYGVGIAIDPNRCASDATCHIAVMLGGGTGASGVVSTTTGGRSWNTAQMITTTSNDVPWLADFLNAGFGQYPGGAAFDNLGHVYTGGEGVFFNTPPTAGKAVTFISQTAGIEESLSTSIVTSANTSGKLLVATWDLNCFVNLAMPYASFPTTANRGCYSTNGRGLQHTYNVDWASTDPSFFVALSDNQQGYTGGSYTSYAGKSADGGVSWSGISPPPPVSAGGYYAGCIAAASSTNYLWAPTDGVGGNVAPYYTVDSGSTWSQIRVSGATGGWPWRGFLPSKICASDRDTASNPNTFYLYNWNTGSGRDAIVKCTNGGASCAIQSSPNMGGNAQFLPVLKTVPGKAGHLFLSNAGNSPIDSSTGKLVYSTDGGVHTRTVPKLTGVLAYGFGGAFTGHTYPAIVVAGVYNGVYGIWRSIDWDGAQTWQQISTYPRDLPLTMEDIDGDKMIPNVFYYTTNSGVFCSAPSTSYCNGGT